MEPVRSLAILSIDGGGVRGIIPAVVLQKIAKRCKTPICKLFDLIVGTSTGALVAAALTTPGDTPGEPRFTAKELVAGYESMAGQIFSRTLYWTITTGNGLYGPKYPVDGIEKVTQFVGGSLKIKEALTNVAITSYEISQREPWVFTNSGLHEDVLISDIIRASTSAETYFSPKTIELDGHTYTYVDGGTFANNPAQVASSIASKIYKSTPVSLFLSLGTGMYSPKIDAGEAGSWGAIGWVTKGELVDTMFNAAVQTVNQQMEEKFAGQNVFFRFQTSVPSDHSGLDDASHENMMFLKAKAKEMIKANQLAFDEVCNKLVQRINR